MRMELLTSTKTAELNAKRRGIATYIPILEWLPRYQRSWLPFDIIAGLSVWALLVPQGIAYSSIAGVPAQYGLYTALGALLGYALFGTSKQVITGPSATVAAVSATVVALMAASGSSEWVSYTAALSISAGVVYLVLGLARMGWIANFLSTAVLEGFIFGFGLGLIVDQSHKILGVPSVDGSYWDKLVGTLKELPETNVYTMAIGLTAIVLLLLMRRFLPSWPRALIVVILGIGVSYLLEAAQYGIKIVGTVPTGLPSIELPGIPYSSIPALLAGGLAVIFVGYSESLASAKDVGSKHGYEIDPSQEMVGQGMANTASGLMGGYVVDGSLSKTTVADLAGQKTQVASLVTAGLILLTVLFLAQIFTDLPQAVLGAVVIDAAIGLVKVKVFRHVLAVSRRDFAAYLAAAAGLFFIGVLAGVLIGVALSLLLLIAASSSSPVRRLGLDAGENVYVDADKHPEAETIAGVVIAEIDGPLFFADAGNFRQSVLNMVAQYSPHTVVADLEPATTIDMDGADIITKLSEELGRKNVKLVLARVPLGAMDLLSRAGTLGQIGEENVYETVRAAVAAVANSSEAEAVPA